MKEFKVSTTHIRLVQRLNIRQKDGLPNISSKRPFGNSSYYKDILKITNNDEEPFIERNKYEDILVTEKGVEKADKLMEELVTVLEILQDTLRLEPATYVKRDGHWRME